MDAEEDFLDDETTKIHEGYESDYPHAARTVVSHDAASQFTAEKRPTPVVPASETDSRVSDLFGPDSFGPAVDAIDPQQLDSDQPAVAGSVPEAPGIPAERFQLKLNPMGNRLLVTALDIGSIPPGRYLGWVYVRKPGPKLPVAAIHLVKLPPPEPAEAGGGAGPGDAAKS